MRAGFVQVLLGVCLVVGLACARGARVEAAVPKGPRPVAVFPTNPPSGLARVARQAPRAGLSTPLRLPVHVAPWMPLRPAHGGETFYTVSFRLYYGGGRVTLAGDAAGTRVTSVDDQMIMKVTHPDGTVSTYQDKEFAEVLPPMDLSRYFRRGVNAVEVTLRDVMGDVMSSTDLWLTDKAPAAARLPVLLHEGVVPETAWPEALAEVTVLGPRPDRRVVLAGDRQGKAGTWATGELTLRVTHADGSAADASYDYGSPEGPPELRPPLDVTSLFGPGTNRVQLSILGGDMVASSPLWLVPLPEAAASREPSASVPMAEAKRQRVTSRALGREDWTPKVQGTGASVVANSRHLVEVTFSPKGADDPAVGLFRAGAVGRGRLRGDFDIQVDYELLGWPKGNGVRVGLVTTCGDVERTSRGAADFRGTPAEVYSANLGAHAVITDLWTEGEITFTATKDQRGTMRLVRHGGRMTGYARQSGKWVQLGTAAVPTADARFAMMAWSHDSRFTHQAVRAAFDRFVINSGTLVLDAAPGEAGAQNMTHPTDSRATGTAATSRAEREDIPEGGFPPSFTGDPKAPVKLIVYFPINQDHKPMVDYLKSLPDKFGGRVYVEVYDMIDPQGQEKWADSGLSCAGVFVNGKTHWVVRRGGKKESVDFLKRMGSFWSSDDLEAVIRSQLADPARIPEVPARKPATADTE